MIESQIASQNLHVFFKKFPTVSHILHKYIETSTKILSLHKLSGSLHSLKISSQHLCFSSLTVQTLFCRKRYFFLFAFFFLDNSVGVRKQKKENEMQRTTNLKSSRILKHFRLLFFSVSSNIVLQTMVLFPFRLFLLVSWRQQQI